MQLILILIGILVFYKIFSNSMANRSRASSIVDRTRELHNKSDYRGKVNIKAKNEYYVGRAEDEIKIQRRKAETMDPVWFMVIFFIVVYFLTRL